MTLPLAEAAERLRKFVRFAEGTWQFHDVAADITRLLEAHAAREAEVQQYDKAIEEMRVSPNATLAGWSAYADELCGRISGRIQPSIKRFPEPAP